MTAVIAPLRVAVACVALASLTGCVRAQARAPQVAVALEIPPPPARVPIPVILTEPEEAPAEPVAAVPAPPPPRPRENAARDRQPAAPPPAPAAVADAEPSGPVLQTTPNVEAVEQRTLGLLSAAQRDLDRVGYEALGLDARAQYDRAQGFIRQARSALSRKNYDYARQLADKAAAVASLLVKG